MRKVNNNEDLDEYIKDKERTKILEELTKEEIIERHLSIMKQHSIIFAILVSIVLGCLLVIFIQGW